MRIRLQGPGHAASLLTELNRCRQSRRYCDVFLQVGNRTFPAHRAVLACAGSYFRNLFTRAQGSTTTAAVSLEFITPANFEKVLTFIYTGEILIDLIDVGVLYDLAERLGVGELKRACHATFPDLQASVAANCKLNSPPSHGLDPGMVTTAAMAAVTAASVSASSMCSSAASCSSLSSSAGPSATPTPAAAPSPFFQSRTPRTGQEAHSLSLNLKAEEVQSHIGYAQMAPDHERSGHNANNSSVALGPVLQLKVEHEMGEEEDEDISRAAVADEHAGSAGDSLSQIAEPAPSEVCSFPDSSAQLAAEVCVPTSSSGGDPLLSSLLVDQAQCSEVDVPSDSGLMFRDAAQEDRVDAEEEREVLQGTDEEQWRQLGGEIIELSDDENYIEEGDEEEEEDDLVCVENGQEGSSSSQVCGTTAVCKACAAPLPMDPAAIRRHAESHLAEPGQCRVCGAAFPDRTTGLAHALSHVGIRLFTCSMCRLQFCSLSKLLRHHRHTQASSGYTIPQGALTISGQDLNSDLQCAVCMKTLSKDFQDVRDHLLSHVCVQSLSCGVCQLPQLSLCSLLWHALTHLSLPVFPCPHCACCFVERPLLDRHMSMHAEEAAAKERERSALRTCRVSGGPLSAGAGGIEALHCFLCPQTFHSSSAFQYHLSLHTSESLGGAGGPSWLGKRKAEHPLECPPSSCSSSSPREASGLSKMSSLGLGLGLGMSFGLSDKALQGPIHSLPPGALTNGSSGPAGLAAAAGAAGVRGKWYRCRYCGKRFAHSGEFTYHLRIHTGEKPYQCKVCLRFFRGRSTMICHLKTHAGALMYRCTVCGLYFSTLKMVSSHMELHKGHLPPNFHIEQTFMYNDHSKESLTNDT